MFNVNPILITIPSAMFLFRKHNLHIEEYLAACVHAYTCKEKKLARSLVSEATVKCSRPLPQPSPAPSRSPRLHPCCLLRWGEHVHPCCLRPQR